MRRSRIVPAVLFLLTCASTWLVVGPAFAAAIMTILVFHEMGHYLQARRYRVPASLPYFIPFPSLFGTMGAVIRMNNVGADRRVLFDIGVTGPLAGLAVAVPATVWGLAHSQIVATGGMGQTGLYLGDSLLFKALTWIVLGPIPEGSDVMLHPVAFAGWAGLFLTALNLLPIGQLDGGHVTYALFGRRAHTIAIVSWLAFVGTIIFINHVLILMAILVFLIGLRHPPTADDTVPLGGVRTWVGYAALAFFVLSFTPDPISFTRH